MLFRQLIAWLERRREKQELAIQDAWQKNFERHIDEGAWDEDQLYEKSVRQRKSSDAKMQKDFNFHELGENGDGEIMRPQAPRLSVTMGRDTSVPLEGQRAAKATREPDRWSTKPFMSQTPGSAPKGSLSHREGTHKKGHSNEDETVPAVQRPFISVPAAPQQQETPWAQQFIRAPVGAVVRTMMPLDTPDIIDQRHTRVRQAASRMRDRSYTVKMFLDDMVASFPELHLYLANRGTAFMAMTTSGRPAEVEYKRTIGAFFSLYWLMRLELPAECPNSRGMDGQRGFCFGVDLRWIPPSAEKIERVSHSNSLTPAERRRMRFYNSNEYWSRLQSLLIDAGLLRWRTERHLEIVEERVVAMLTLTAIHDIMKIEALLPTVLPEHAPYHGMAAHSTIVDHDIALTYILEKDPGALPSYNVLGPQTKAAIRFTQAELGFNHGWLVQAEAPPGAIFGKLKALLDKDGLSGEDIAFYFVHWITDLGGANAAPERGAEKFVLGFPQQVFRSLVNSMSLVQKLANTSSSRLYLEYLRTSWRNAVSAGAKNIPQQPPTGDSSIAAMRLLAHCQATDDQEAVITAFNELPHESHLLLADEMSLTGLENETYELTPLVTGGPAFLVYYAPELIRLAAAQDVSYLEARRAAREQISAAVSADLNKHGAGSSMLGALRMLEDVYRAARTLWPLVPDSAGKTVTIHIGQIKSDRVVDVARAHDDGHCWLLVRRSDVEAVVERHPIEDFMNPTGITAQKVQKGDVALLRFWPSRVLRPSKPLHEDSFQSKHPERDPDRSYHFKYLHKRKDHGGDLDYSVHGAKRSDHSVHGGKRSIEGKLDRANVDRSHPMKNISPVRV